MVVNVWQLFLLRKFCFGIYKQCVFVNMLIIKRLNYFLFM